jgi:hypothetical protein
MDAQLRKLFYNPKTGLVGFTILWERVKEQQLPYKHKQVKAWYDDQPVNQLFKQPQKVKQFNKIQSLRFAPGTFQVDLMDFQRFAQYNGGINYLLNIIDVWSRYAWSFPIKSKESKNQSEIAPILSKVIKEVNAEKNTFTFDKGTEFLGKVKVKLHKKNAKIHLNDPESIHSHHTVGLIERFNKTMLNKIRKYMNVNDTVVYVDAIPDMVYNYNHTVHSTIHKKPYDVLKKGVNPITVIDNNTEPVNNDFLVGDWVRYQKKRKTFDKLGFLHTHSMKTHKIIGQKGLQYILDNNKAFYPEQLVNATEGENMGKLKKKHKEVAHDERIRKERHREITHFDIPKNVIEGKRTRKPSQKVIDSVR